MCVARHGHDGHSLMNGSLLKPFDKTELLMNTCLNAAEKCSRHRRNSLGLDRIIELASEVKVAIMCSESQPLTKHKIKKEANCHRFGMLAPLLRARGADVIHILPDGKMMQCDESSFPSIW